MRLGRLILESLAVFAVALVAALALILRDDEILSIDGFYHFALVRAIWESGPVVDVAWLPLTILGSTGPDHHWLWHVLLAPFGAIEDRRQGLMAALAANAALVPTAFYAVCRLLAVRYAWLWTLLLGASGLAFVSRLLMLRAQNIAIAYLLLFLFVLLRRKYLAMAGVSFLFLSSYYGAIVLGLPVGLFFAIRGLRERRWDLRLLALPIAGFVAAIVLSPWFPANIEYLSLTIRSLSGHLHAFLEATNAPALPVGREWWPTPPGRILSECALVHALVVGSVIGAYRGDRSRLCETPVLVLVGTTLGTLGLYVFANRFLEYYVPVALLSAAFLASGTLEKLDRRFRSAIFLGLLGLGVWQLARFPESYAALPKSSLHVYSGIASELERRAEPGSLVFNSHWGDFPYLVWQAPTLRFVAGLDPRYLAFEDPSRFALFQQITGSDPPTDVVNAIRGAFSAEWVVLRHYDDVLFARLRENPSARLVLSTEWGHLFHLTGPARAPT